MSNQSTDIEFNLLNMNGFGVSQLELYFFWYHFPSEFWSH